MEDQVRPVAFITGISGQDGYYLSRILLNKGYLVHGLIRPSSRNFNLHTYKPEVRASLKIHYGDILDFSCLLHILSNVKIDEIYHLAAQSHVGVSFTSPLYTSDVNALGTLRLLQIIIQLKLQKKIKFYNACSSEVFGRVVETPQTESTPFRPLSPYANAKAYAFWATSNTREAYGLFAVNGILFNHESPERNVNFVTRKITTGVAQIACGARNTIRLGNLDAERDWSHAKDFMRGVYMMMQYPEPGDYILASGIKHSVREFAEHAFKEIGVNLIWQGEGSKEVGKDRCSGSILIEVDESLCRDLEVPSLQGSAKKAADVLFWKADTSFQDLVKEMVGADLELVRRGYFIKSAL